MFHRPRQVITCVEKYFDFPSGTLWSPTKSKAVSLARALAQYLINEENVYSPEEIAKRYFNNDRKSIVSNIAKIAKNKENDALISTALAELRQELSSHHG